MAPARRDAPSREDDGGESGGPRAKPRSGWISDDEDEVPVEPVTKSRRPSDGVPFLFRRVAYISDSYLSQSVYQSYALLLGAVTLTVGGGYAYNYIDTSVAVFDGMWATFTWISTGILSSGVVPGTNASRAVAGALVIVGILYFSVVLALVVEAVQFKMKALREGKSMVVEKDHIVMLGWGEKSLLFIKEIILANESEGGGVVVVLCADGKEKMERELSLMLKKREMKGTSVVFRQGSRLMVGDLDKVSVHTAKAVVVFSNSNVDSDKADAEVLQVVLNLSNLDLKGHVVAEVKDKDNEALIHLIGRGNVETVVSHDVIGRLMLMSVRQPGLAEVYGSVLGFDGDEFYSSKWPELVGVKFKDLHLMFPDAIPLGLKEDDGPLELNPKHDRVITASDELVVLAEDNDTYRPKRAHECDPGRVPWFKGTDEVRENILFAGWRRDLRDILLLLDAMCAPGSEIHIMASVALSDRDRLLAEGGLEVETLRNIKLVHHVGNTAMRRHLELLGIERFTSVIVFADEEEEGDIMQSDSKCLATLLLIRNIQKAKRAKMARSPSSRKMLGLDDATGTKDRHGGRIPIVTEILDPRTQQTIQSNEEMRAVSDFLQSNDMVSKILAMVCEDRSVKNLLDELLTPRGSSMACVPASRYCRPGERLSFFEMACRCQEYGEILIGYLEEDRASRGEAHAGRRFKAPFINPVNKRTPFSWDDNVCCLLTGGPAVEDVMASKAKFMDSSFAKKMGLGLTSVLEVDEEDFMKLVVTAFKRFDDDKSGALELPEILEAFHTLPLKATEEQVKAKFAEFDADDSGGLDMLEFETMMRQLRDEQTTSRIMDVSESEFDEMCEVTFARFDEDGSGGLDLEEIVRAFQKLPLRETSEDEVRARFTKHDVDRSGALDQAEFRDLMRELRRENAKKSAAARPRLDAVERADVRNVVSMAEVKLGKLRADERDEAMAHILALVNEGRFVREKKAGKASGGGVAYGDAGEYAGNPRSPLARAAGASVTPSGVALGMVAGVTTPAGTDTARDGWASNPPGPARDDRERNSGSVSEREPNGASRPVGSDARETRFNSSDDELSEYASYVAERLTQMPAMRRNQVVQVVDLLADSFACGQSVPATRLLGVLSSFQAFPGGPGGTGGARERRGLGVGSAHASPHARIGPVPYGATPTGAAPASAYSRSASLGSNRSGYRSESPREERGPDRPRGAPPREPGSRGAATYY
jgi:hypothetical protein